MKSNKIRALVLLLILTLSYCGFFDRKTDENNLEDISLEAKNKSKSKLRNKNKSKALSPSNTWETGFKFPKFEVKKKEDKDYMNLEEITVYPKKMQTVNDLDFPNAPNASLSENQLGFVMELSPTKIETAKELSFTSSINGKKILIPWRYFKEKPYFQNPFYGPEFSRKIVQFLQNPSKKQQYNPANAHQSG